MKTNLQYVDKQLVHRVISKDDSLLQRRTPMYTPPRTQKHTPTKDSAKTARKISVF